MDTPVNETPKTNTTVFSLKDLISISAVLVIVGIYHNKVDNLEKETQALRNDQKVVYEKIDRMYELLITQKY